MLTRGLSTCSELLHSVSLGWEGASWQLVSERQFPDFEVNDFSILPLQIIGCSGHKPTGIRPHPHSEEYQRIWGPWYHNPFGFPPQGCLRPTAPGHPSLGWEVACLLGLTEVLWLLSLGEEHELEQYNLPTPLPLPHLPKLQKNKSVCWKKQSVAPQPSQPCKCNHDSKWNLCPRGDGANVMVNLESTTPQCVKDSEENLNAGESHWNLVS